MRFFFFFCHVCVEGSLDRLSVRCLYVRCFYIPTRKKEKEAHIHQEEHILFLKTPVPFAVTSTQHRDQIAMPNRSII